MFGATSGSDAILFQSMSGEAGSLPLGQALSHV